MTAIIDGTLGTTTPALTSTATPTVVTPQSMVRSGSLSAGSGFGSTNTAIRTFATTISTQGSDISVGGSVATLGSSFTINTAGVYSISYSDNANAASWYGISLNSANLTTSVFSLPLAELLAMGTSSAANLAVNVNWEGYLAAGSVIRPHGVASQAAGSNTCTFTITRVA